MGDLRPIGSEKLQGNEKLNRILEIANYGNSTNHNVSESRNEDYKIQLADGQFYGIVKEKSGYIVKRGINEGQMDYLDPIKNRKYHKSFAQAMKKINLTAGELNRIHENEEGINLIGEQKKFVLKTPKPEVPDAPIEPAGAEQQPDLGGEEMGGDEQIDLGGEEMGAEQQPDLGSEEMGGQEQPDLGGEEMGGLEDTEMGGDEDDITIKSIQKLTGKLGQKIRTIQSREGLQSQDIKYVLNSIISAFDLTSLNEDDKEEILTNIEGDDSDYGIDDDVSLDIKDDEFSDESGDLEIEDIPQDEKELGEEYDDFSFDDGMKRVVDELFSESKVDKVLSKYYVITEEEKKEKQNQEVKNFINHKVKVTQVKQEIKRLSETIEQEMASEFLIKENKKVRFVGKSNLKNLIFEDDKKQYKISPTGELL